MRAIRVSVVWMAALAFLSSPALGQDVAAIESFLRDARVVSIEEIGAGITKPQRAVLELNGEERKAAFKTVALHFGQRRIFVGDDAMLMFTDDYRYERAAYLLDRCLGLDMVPVTVLREIKGKEGALIEWVGGAVNEFERRAKRLEPPDPRTLERQREIMKVFDLLILNSDRNLSNQLITTDDWKLHLIDHSRSFRMEKKLPEDSEDEPLRLPRRLYEGLRALEEQELRELFRGLIGKARVKAMLARRDLIVERIERDRERLGDEAVFH